MKQDLPTILTVAAFSLLFFARNWLTWLITDSFWSWALPTVMCLLALVLFVATAILWLQPRTKPARKHLPSTIVMLTCVAMSIVGDGVYLRGLPAGSFSAPFQSDRWQDESSQRPVQKDLTPRQKMLGHVVTRLLPISNRLTIERELGTPPDAGYFAELKPDLLYYLGPQRDGLFRMDSEWLAIWFSNDGSVARWEMLTD